MKKFQREDGFTLVELLIVVAIIGILMALALAGLRFAQQRARDLQRQNAIRNIATSLEAYYVDNRVYPSGSTTVQALVETELAEYIGNTFELPGGVGYESIGFVTTSDNLGYLVCILPENKDTSVATSDDLLTAGTDSTLESSCLAEISTN